MVNPVAILPVNGMPRFVIIVVGKSGDVALVPPAAPLEVVTVFTTVGKIP